MTSIAVPRSAGNDRSIIALISTCHGLSHFFQLAAPALYILMAPALSLSYSDLGLSLVVFSTVSAIGQPLSGIIVDRVGALTMLIFGTALYAIGIAAIGLSQGLITLIMASTIAGIGNSIYHPCDLSIINHKVAHHKLPLAYSFHIIGGQIGWVLAPVTMIALANMFDWRTSLLIASVPGFVLPVVLFVYRHQLEYKISSKETHRSAVPDKTFLKMLSIPWIWIMLLFFAMHSLATMPIPQFGQVIFQQLHQLSKEVIASYASLFLLSSATGTLLGGLMLGKKISGETLAMSNDRQFTTANTTAIIAMGIAGIAYISMMFVPSYMLAISLIVSGFCVGMTSPSRDSLVRIMTKGKNQGKAYGIIYSGLDLGMLFAPAVIGVLIDSQMIASTLLVPATGCWLAVLIILLTKKSNSFSAREESA